MIRDPFNILGGKTLSLAIYLEVNQSFKLGAPLKFWFARPVLQICAYRIKKKKKYISTSMDSLF